MASKNPYYSGPVSDHFDGTHFFLKGAPAAKGPLAVLRWQFSQRDKVAWPKEWPSTQTKPAARVDGDALRVTYVGHATMLIQTAGLNILTDPVWSDRASPYTFIGPKRINAPGVRIEDLPPLDLILLSHNHYDHMDSATLMRLSHDNPCRIITPLGNDAILRAFERPVNADAYDWGTRVEIVPGIAIHLGPSQHWSARGLNDRRMALWASFVIETPGGKILYIGDTAYGDGEIFRALHRMHGSMRLAILPIGAYEPRWFMRDQHVDPEEAVRVFQGVDAAYAVAHHWGTFRLTDEAVDDPPKRLAIALERAGLAPDRFVTRRPGEVFDVPTL